MVTPSYAVLNSDMSQSDNWTCLQTQNMTFKLRCPKLFRTRLFSQFNLFSAWLNWALWSIHTKQKQTNQMSRKGIVFEFLVWMVLTSFLSVQLVVFQHTQRSSLKKICFVKSAKCQAGVEFLISLLFWCQKCAFFLSFSVEINGTHLL